MPKIKMKYKRLNEGQRRILLRRGLDPKNYVLIKETYTSLYLRDLRDGSVKLLMKYN